MPLDRRIVSALLSILFALAAVGQEVSIAGKTEFAPYRFAEFEAVAPDKWACTWEFPEELQTRELDAKSRKMIAVGPPGKYTVRLFVAGLTGDENNPLVFKRTSKTFTIGDAPEPKPDDEDDDSQKPAPIPDAGFRVLIVYESGETTTYPTETMKILTGREVREFLDKNCVDEGKGHPAWRIFDADMDLENEYPVWKKAMARDRKELPWVIISNGKTGFEGPLPKTSAAFIELCKKYLPK
jgi:hypothetical protein